MNRLLWRFLPSRAHALVARLTGWQMVRTITRAEFQEVGLGGQVHMRVLTADYRWWRS